MFSQTVFCYDSKYDIYLRNWHFLYGFSDVCLKKMKKDESLMKNETLKKKIDILEHSLAESAGAYYNINLTRDLVPGLMYQVVDGKEYSLNEQMGLPENACFSDVVAFWGNRLPEDQKPAYFDFLSISNLLNRFHQGETHVFHKYWTKSAVFEPMLAEQHIVMFQDEENGDILAVTYVMDLTQKDREEKQEKLEKALMEKLEQKQQSLENSLRELNKEKKILDVLSIDYTSVYYCDLIEDTMFALKQGNDTNAAITEQQITTGVQSSYSFRIQYYFEHFVIRESAPDFVEKLSAEYLMEYLRHNKRFAYRFRAHPNPAGQQCFEVQFARLEDTDGFKVVMGYRYIDDIIAEQEKQKIQLENALAEVTLNSEIINSISKLYWLIYRIDLIDGTYEEISAGQDMHRLTGKCGSAEEILREARETVVAPEHQEMMKEFLDISTLPERLKDTESVAVEYHAKMSSWHLARFIVKKRDKYGHVTHVLYVVRQIDAEKQKEAEYKQKLMETAEDARRANMAKTDFLRRMSHDIRTPINGIMGMIAIADHYSDDVVTLKRCREKVKEAVGFLLDLVNNILDMNKLESGSIILDHKPFDLFQILKEVSSIAEMDGEIRNLTISFNYEKTKHFHLIGSPLHLKQILQNVVGNAVKYNKDGGSIQFSTEEISCGKGKGVYQFVCADSGRGMSESYLEHAFEPFSQEEDNARTSYMGTGLGLTITKQLVEMMGGVIEVKSKRNVGTVCTITIPIEIDYSYREDIDTKKEVKDDRLVGVKVLLAEDNELNMEIAQFFLENAGMEVTMARNGKEAVNLFSMSPENYFDVILMDIMMPVMDGLTATEAIRGMSRKDAGTIPIFAMTANAFADDVELSKHAGMNEHLSKPLNEEMLLSSIREYMEQKKD